MSTISEANPIQRLLRTFSVEVVTKDQKGIEAVGKLLPPHAEVFVANLPSETPDRLVSACAQINRLGLNAVPHIVARNTHTTLELADTLARLAGEAGVDTCLVLGGDRDAPAGQFDSSLQLIETGLFQKHGIRRVAFAAHPEGHPRVPDAVIWPALPPKLAAAKAAGLESFLVSQFCFDAAPILALARRLRADGITAPLRVGVAGPAKRTTLIKYALMCGVGASLRALRERSDLAANMAAGETPEALLRELAIAQSAEPELGLDSVHFFTFGSVTASIELAAAMSA